MKFSRRSLLLSSAMVSAALVLAACQTADGASSTASNGSSGSAGAADDSGRISVVASTNVYGDIAQDIGGDLVSVHSIIAKAGADPHGYEATPQDKLAVSRAQIGIENGGGYDDFFIQLADGQLDDGAIINASELSGLDGGDNFNEHVWYSLPTMSKLADELAIRFSSELPDATDSFKKNATDFKATLAGLESRLAALQDKHKQTPIAITEPVPLYLLEEAGLVNQTPEKFTEAVENGSDAPATVLKETTALFDSGKIALLAYNEQTGSAQTEQVRSAAEAAGVPVVNFSETLPQGDSYLGWMAGNVTALEQALAAARP